MAVAANLVRKRNGSKKRKIKNTREPGQKSRPHPLSLLRRRGPLESFGRGQSALHGRGFVHFLFLFSFFFLHGRTCRISVESGTRALCSPFSSSSSLSFSAQLGSSFSSVSHFLLPVLFSFVLSFRMFVSSVSFSPRWTYIVHAGTCGYFVRTDTGRGVRLATNEITRTRLACREVPFLFLRSRKGRRTARDAFEGILVVLFWMCSEY